MCISVCPCHVAAPTTSSDRVCLPCQAHHYFDARTRQCRPVTNLWAGIREVQGSTPTSDRVGTADMATCNLGRWNTSDSACQCPDNDNCTACRRNVASEQAYGAVLESMHKIPAVFTLLEPCRRVQAHEAPKHCAAVCKTEVTCVGFSVRNTSNMASECCLYNFTDQQRTLPKQGAAYFSMPQCQACKAGYGKLWRQCVALSPAPVLESGKDLLELYIPDGTPAGTLVHSLRVSRQTFNNVIQDPIQLKDKQWHFALERGGGATSSSSASSAGQGDDDNQPIIVEADGSLRLAKVFTQPSSAVIIVTDDSAQCIRQQPGSMTVEVVRGGCQSRLVVALQTASFLNCPSSMEIYSTDGQPVDVAWTDPILPTYLGNLTVNRSLGNTTATASPYRYGLGQHEIVYAVGLPVLGLLRCSFHVIVRQGLGLRVKKLLETQEPGMAQQYLVVEPAISGKAVAHLQDLQMTQSGAFRVGLRHEHSSLFTIRPQADMRVYVRIWLTWCQWPWIAPRNKTMWKSWSIHVDVAEARRQHHHQQQILSFHNVGSAITHDGTCVRFHAESEDITSQLSFASLNMMMEGVGGLISPDSIFQPAAHYDVSVVGELPLVDEPMETKPKPSLALTLSDTLSPVFLNCPTRIIEVVAAPGKLTATAAWTAPVAIDDMEPYPRVTSSHAPGSFFSIVDSPHLVEYWADDGTNRAQCRFYVQVSFQARQHTVVERLRDNPTRAGVFLESVNLFPTFFPGSVVDMIHRRQRVVRQPLRLSYTGAAPWMVLQDLDTASFTQLRLEFKPEFNERPLPLWLRTMPQAHYGHLAMHLVWWREGSNSSGWLPTPQDDVGVWLEFEGYELDEAKDLSAEAAASVMPVSGRLQSADVAIDADAGVISITKAFSLPFRRGFRFTKLTLVLDVPQGRPSSGGEAAWHLSQDSFFFAEYVYPHDLTKLEMNLSQYAGLTLYEVKPPTILHRMHCSTTPVTEPGKNYWHMLISPPDFADANGLDPSARYPYYEKAFVRRPNDPPHSVTASVADGTGLIAEDTLSFTVMDKEAPDLQLKSQANLLVQLPSALRQLRADVLASELMQWPVFDNALLGVNVTLIGDNQQVTGPSESGTELHLKLRVGQHLVQVIAVDAWSNSVSRNTTVDVLDNTAPSIVCPPDMDFLTDGHEVAAVWSPPTADDNAFDGMLEGKPLVWTEPASGTSLPLGLTVVKGFARDGSGNVASCEFRVEVKKRPRSVGDYVRMAVIMVFVGVLAASLWYAYTMQRKHWQPENWDEIFKTMELFAESVADGSGPKKPRELEREAVTLLEELGMGAFGLVCKGTLRETKVSAAYLVAAKMLRADMGEGLAKQELLEEAAILAQFNHAHVTHLIGVVTVGSPVVMVVEFLEHGSLKKWLERSEPLLSQQLLWAGDVASGLAHVHGKGFLHRDVAARNVLLSSALRAKISDFGLARELSTDANYYRSRGGQIPVRWTAPEALISRRFSMGTDVWAFGILMHELWTRGATPYGTWSQTQVWVAVTEGYILPQEASCPDAVYEVMQQCWQRDAGQRPTMAKVEKSLRAMDVAEMSKGLSLANLERGQVGGREDHDYVDFARSESRKLSAGWRDEQQAYEYDEGAVREAWTENCQNTLRHRLNVAPRPQESEV